jgi:type I restriction enzyme S subunit
MDFKTFLENFDAIAEAPGGIPKLRSLILDRAVRGKLVPQNPEDEPAVVLVKRIRDLRTQSGRKAKPSSLSSNEKIDLPKLPESWDWCRVEQIATVCLGSTPSRKEPAYWDGHIPWVSSGEVANCRIKNTKERITKLGIENSSTTIYPKETVLIAIIGQGKTRGQSAILDIEACTNQNVAGLVFDAGNMLPDYVWKWALSEYEQTRSGSRGGAQPALNGQKIRDLLIPVPPLAEQKRIVAKVDELMALCDRYEATKQTRDNLRQKLRESAIASLMNAETDEELDAAWAVVRDNWCELSQHPKDVDDLRRSVLQLAVRGKLVPQNSSDKPASQLLKEIEVDKQRLIKERKIKQCKSLPEIQPEEVPYKLPKGWEWVRLGYVGEFINGDRGKNYPNRDEYVDEGIPWINTGHIEPDGSLTQTEMNFISREKFNSLNNGKIQPGDLVYCLRGATFGKTAIVDPYQEGAIASSLMIIRPFPPCSNRYIYRYLVSPIGRNQIYRFDNGSAQPNLSANSVQLYVFPLPPLAEQKRIVAKVDELMQMCERLEESLRQSQQRAESLAASAISHLTI